MTASVADFSRMPPSSLSPQDEEARAVALRKMKLVATGFLVLALMVFLVARLYESAYPWLGYVRATAEASLVGGLADWFAVTALFRRPLGLPIPHTAIMQTQKDRVGRILGNFVQSHFLSRSVLHARLTGMCLADRAAQWLGDQDHRRELAHQLAGGLSRAVSALPEEEVKDFVQRTAVSRLESVQFAPADRRHPVGGRRRWPTAGTARRSDQADWRRPGRQPRCDPRQGALAESPRWLPLGCATPSPIAWSGVAALPLRAWRPIGIIRCATSSSRSCTTSSSA